MGLYSVSNIEAYLGEFWEGVKQQLAALPPKDACLFAWLCAVRALPFLGARGDFSFWDDLDDGDMRQQYLAAVLLAIDCAAMYSIGDLSELPVYVDSEALAKAALEAGHAAPRADAAFAAANAAFSADSQNYDETTVMYAVSAADSTFSVAYSTLASIDITPVLLQDLADIKAGKREFQKSRFIYGKREKIWLDFQLALYDVGCEYWADWYDNLFEKGFCLDDQDIEEIKTRLCVPSQIKEEGASAISLYMERSSVES